MPPISLGRSTEMAVYEWLAPKYRILQSKIFSQIHMSMTYRRFPSKYVGVET